MFDEKPFRTIRIILNDIEHSNVFSYGKNSSDKTISIKNATSMSEQDLRDFAFNSAVAQAMKTELINRGVNIENIMSLTAGSAFDGYGV